MFIMEYAPFTGQTGRAFTPARRNRHLTKTWQFHFTFVATPAYL